MSDGDRNEILYDYEEHFRIGMENGKTEEEISESLGDVKSIARQFMADYTVRQAETNASCGNIFKAVIAAGALGFFNLIFVLGPFLGLIGVMIGLFAAALGLLIGGLGAILGTLLSPVFPYFINLGGLDIGFLLFSSVGITCLGLLFFIGDCYLARLFSKGTLKYIKWNIEVIKK
jgi:uncharacterized membrane protein